MSTTRAVVRGVEPGNDVRCVRCGKQIKFTARTHPRQVIANVYLEGAWNRVDHFHEECYLDAGEPYGRIDTSVLRLLPEQPSQPDPAGEDVVTGTGGFIGSALVRALRGRGDEVYPVVRRPPGQGEVGIDLARRVPRRFSRVLAGTSKESTPPSTWPALPITTRWSPKRLEEHSFEPCRPRQPPWSLASLDARGPRLRLGGRLLRRSHGRGARRDESPRHRRARRSLPLLGAKHCSGGRSGHPGRHDPDRHRARRCAGAPTVGSWPPRSPSSGSASVLVLATAVSGRAGSLSTTRSPSFLRAIDDTRLCGPVNSTAPNPVRNPELTDAIAHALGRRSRLALVLQRCCGSRLAAGPPTSCCSPARGCCPRSWQMPAMSMPMPTSRAPWRQRSRPLYSRRARAERSEGLLPAALS